MRRTNIAFLFCLQCTHPPACLATTDFTAKQSSSSFRSASLRGMVDNESNTLRRRAAAARAVPAPPAGGAAPGDIGADARVTGVEDAEFCAEGTVALSRTADSTGTSESVDRSARASSNGPCIWSRMRRAAHAIWTWETPAAYRTRLRVAFLLLVLAATARYFNGGRLDLSWMLNPVFAGGHEDDGFSIVVFGPNFGFIILSILIRFMLRRPRPASG